jgi:sulfide:quinone oxidoreductase
MNPKTVLVVGAGVGGQVAASRLRQLLRPEHRVILVERNATHAFAPSFLWLMAGERTRDQITRPLSELLRPGIDFVVGEARGLDLQGRRIRVDSQSISYDYLIIASGAELAFDAVPGMSEATDTFYTLEGSERLHERLREFRGGKIAVVVASLPYKCPGAPHEGAMLIADFMRKRGLGDRVEVHLFTPEPQPMPVAGPILGEMVVRMLASRGVVFHPSHKLTALEGGGTLLRFAEGDPVAVDLSVVIPPHRGAGFLCDAGLTNEAGWVPVDQASLATRVPNVYSVGDASAIPVPGRWKPDVSLMLPKAGVFAHTQAEVVARRIAAEITGKAARETFCGEGFCMLEAGEGVAGFAYGDFFATPTPQVHLKRVGRAWHLGKVLFEQWWLTPPGLRRDALRLAIALGSKAYRIPAIV